MDASDNSFPPNFLLLKPENVGVVDLVHILFSHDLEKRKFVDCPEGTSEESFKRRWLIFVSILVQKFLLSTAKPLAWFGSSIENWMNLVSSNRNVGRLFLNYLRGRVVRPDKASAEYLSFTGHLDKRKELGIGKEDVRYIHTLSVMAAKASYENEAYIQNIVNDIWKMKFLGFYDFWNAYQGKATTQAYLFQDKEVEPDLVVVAFRGTETFDADAWSTDFDLSWYELPPMGKVHGGFMKALGLQTNQLALGLQTDQGWPETIDSDENQPALAYYTIRDMLKEIMETNTKTEFIVTGHSLGGALAILFPAILACHKEEKLLDRLKGVYTFGQPRVGNKEFVTFMKDQFERHKIQYYRSVYCNDLVPRVPYDDKTLMFKHFGTCLYYNSFYKGKIVDEEPNKNYFSPLSEIPKTITSIWELIRSFVIPYTKGPDYKEGTLLRVHRVIGLMIAGIPAHSTQDYVNATRLGDLNLYISINGPTTKDVERKEN